MSHDKHCHDKCEHKKLKYCRVCNVVYCEDCNEEWGKWVFTYTYPYTSTYYEYPNTTATQISFTDCNHYQ